MRLAVLNVAYPFAPAGPDAVGGAEQILGAVDAAIARAGHRSLVLGCEGSRAADRLFTVPRLEGLLTPERRAEAQERYRDALERILVAEPVDLVHFHGVDFHAYLPEAPVAVLATLHLPPSFYPPQVFTSTRPRTYLNSVSPSQRRACPPCSALLDDVPNGVDLARLRPSGARGDHALVLGRICPEKGIHLAIEAARRANVPLLLAGEVFPYPEHVRYFQEEIQPRLDAQCRFLGPVGMAQKAELLACARCLIVPSLVAETSSLVTMEALACGTPVIAFPRGALPDLITHGRTGFLVDNLEQMVEALQRSPGLAAADCRAAAERFSVETMGGRYLALYAWIAGSKGPHRPLSAPREAAVTIGEAREMTELEALAPEWEALWERCPEATVFQRADWVLPWCAHLLQGEARAVTVRRGARLVGLAPFFLWRDGDARVLSILGAGASDYLDVLAESSERASVARALGEWLRDRQSWDRCEWSELRASSLLLGLAEAWPGRSTTSPQDVCPGLLLTGCNRLEDALPKGLWARVAYARRRAVRAGGLVVDEATPETLEVLFDHLAALHAARWRERGGRGMLAAAPIRAFHREVSRRLLARGALVLSALRIGGEVAAVLYGFHDRAAVRYYLGGFNPEHRHFSPGTLLVAHAIERAIARGADVLDFLRGAEPYKYTWGAQDLTPLSRSVFWRGGAPIEAIGHDPRGAAKAVKASMNSAGSSISQSWLPARETCSVEPGMSR